MRPIIAAAVVLCLAGCAEERSQAAAAAKPKAAVQELPSPAGPNAAEPFLFTTRDGVGLSWLEPVANSNRVALRFAVHRGGQWSAPRTIVERNDLFVNWADFPSVLEDAKGTLYAHWLQKSGKGTYSYDVRMTTSTDGGATWRAPFLLNRDGKQAEHGFVTLAALPGGGIGATWLDGRHMTAEHGDMTLRYATVDARGSIAEDVALDDRTCECCTTGMTVSATGPVIVYRDRTATEMRDIAYVRRDANGWSKPRPLRADRWTIDGCPVNGPQIDASGRHVAAAWFTAANEQQRVYVAFSADGGATFGQAIVVDDGKPAGRVDVVMLRETHALVTWLEQTPAGAEIRARRIARDGVRGASTKIADASTARAAGFTRIARTRDAIWFTWTGHDATGKKIHVARGRF